MSLADDVVVVNGFVAEYYRSYYRKRPSVHKWTRGRVKPVSPPPPKKKNFHGFCTLTIRDLDNEVMNIHEEYDTSTINVRSTKR